MCLSSTKRREETTADVMEGKQWCMGEYKPGARVQPSMIYTEGMLWSIRCNWKTAWRCFWNSFGYINSQSSSRLKSIHPLKAFPSNFNNKRLLPTHTEILFSYLLYWKWSTSQQIKRRALIKLDTIFRGAILPSLTLSASPAAKLIHHEAAFCTLALVRF